MHLTQGLRRAHQVKPQGVSTSFAGRCQSWSTTIERVARLAGGLASRGAARGERVAILALNSDRYFELMYAIPWLGGVMVPLNTRLATPEIEYILADSGSSVLFIDRAMSVHLAGLAGKMPCVREVVWLDGDVAPDGVLAFDAVASAAGIADAGAGYGDLAGLFYTGGTTGKSKGVMLSHLNLVSNAQNAIAGLGFTTDTIYLHSGPMFHLADGASTFGVTMAAGAHAFVPRFDAGDCLAAIAREKVTHAQFVPTMINMMCDHPSARSTDLSTLRTLLYGASPMPEGVLRRALEIMPDVGFIHGYGMTEASPILSLLDPRYTTLEGPHAGRIRSCGQAAHTVEIRIVGENRKEVAHGVVGEVAAKGPNIMMGYWNKPAETAAALQDGWYYSGDAAYMDAEGFLFIVDRLKDMVISGGENVYSAEVESALSTMQGVAEVAVIGVPDPRWGERVHAIIVPRAGAALSEADVIAHCRTQIAGYKCPRSVEFRSAPLPLSGAGKVLKRELREPHWRGYAKGVN